MLEITVPGQEFWDAEKEEFFYTKETTLKMEHSLLSIAKWESKWHKAYFSKKTEKTNEMVIDYIRCMTITQNVDPLVFYSLTKEQYDAISAYIEDQQSATYIAEAEDGTNAGGTRDVVTSELVYYWMVAFNIPFECQKWHINRLLNLIRICTIKNQPPKKATRLTHEGIQKRRAENEARKLKYKTRG